MRKHTIFFYLGLLAFIMVFVLMAISVNAYVKQVNLASESFGASISEVVEVMPYMSTEFLNYATPMCLMLILSAILFIGDTILGYIRLMFDMISIEDTNQNEDTDTTKEE